jgi:prenyltransferase beta subunit
VERFRKPDGGFSDIEGIDHGTPYGGHLALLAAGSLRLSLPQTRRVLASAQQCRSADGGYAECHGARRGTLPATVSGVVLNTLALRRLPRETVDWFEQCRRGSGFSAAPDVVPPDLLCTATLLAAIRLRRLGIPVGRQTIAEFVESCWAPSGGFGAVARATPDVEYTFYALLALGSLA